MKTLITLGILLFSIKNSLGQPSIKTTTISVKGNCEDCKERIENAADIKGVKLFVWDVDTKIATITYNTDKVTILQIEKAIAKIGYEAGNEKANENAYLKLPECCQYKNRECKK